jgi:hypothetical protein
MQDSDARTVAADRVLLVFRLFVSWLDRQREFLKI